MITALDRLAELVAEMKNHVKAPEFASIEQDAAALTALVNVADELIAVASAALETRPPSFLNTGETCRHPCVCVLDRAVDALVAKLAETVKA